MIANDSSLTNLATIDIGQAHNADTGEIVEAMATFDDNVAAEPEPADHAGTAQLSIKDATSQLLEIPLATGIGVSSRQLSRPRFNTKRDISFSN